MAKTHLREILPQIQRLLDGGVTAGSSDGVLLRRYLASGDEAPSPPSWRGTARWSWAFAAASCATKLRPKTPFRPFFSYWCARRSRFASNDSLGGWLHEVAYRVARRLNAEGRKRAARERLGLAVFDAEARPSVEADPRRASLHEEIARLPAAQRQALVLCLLEGKTQVEASREIGCGEATLRRRLASARARLRARLREDDLDPSPPLLAVSPRLIEAATKLASGSAHAMASAVLREMAGGHLMKLVASLILIVVTAAGVAWALVPSPAPAPPGPPNPTLPAPIRVATEPGPVPEPEPEADDDTGKWGQVEVAGRVVDPDGKPVAGATVFRRKYGIHSPKRKATTDAQGRFAFKTARELGPRRDPNAPKPGPKTTRLPFGITVTVTESESGHVGAAHTDADEVKSIKPWLVATAPGYGFGTLSPGDDVTIRLVPDEPVSGRLVDRTGRPIAGARVRVRNVFWPRREDDPLLSLVGPSQSDSRPRNPEGRRARPLARPGQAPADMNEYIRAEGVLMSLIEFDLLGDRPVVYAPLIAAATSDADGRFTLRGIGRERVAELYIDGVPDKASTLIAVVTRVLRPLDVPALTPETSKIVVNGRPPARAIRPPVRDRTRTGANDRGGGQRPQDRRASGRREGRRADRLLAGISRLRPLLRHHR